MMNSSENGVRSLQTKSRSALYDYEAYDECKRSVLSQPYPGSDGQLYCNATFDDLMCWDYTPAGQTVYQRCPYKFIPAFSQDEFAEKQCMEDGTWFKNIVNRTWTNYTRCITHEESQSVLLIYISGYVISAVLCVASIAIFCGFRQLRCTRVKLHVHLFLSYVISAILWTISYTQLMLRVDVIEHNPVWCRLVHVLTLYISITNYGWMFCEGFFLHTIIVHAFSKEKKLLRICYIIGWGAPAAPALIYTITRAINSNLDYNCWVKAEWPIWFIYGPIVLSLFVNFSFFVNVLRILLSKIRAFNANEHSQYRRAVKATLIMIPLLGIHNLIMIARPELSRMGILVWKMISAFLVAYQGASVALIFCFFNGEVLTVLRRKCDQWRHLYDPTLTARNRSTSNTLAVTLDDTSMQPKNGFACVPARIYTKNAQDPTELQVMVDSHLN